MRLHTLFILVAALAAAPAGAAAIEQRTGFEAMISDSQAHLATVSENPQVR